MAQSTRDSAAEPVVVPLLETTDAPWRQTLGTIDVSFGAGRLQELGEMASGLGRRALLVSDPGLVSAGHVDSAAGALDAAGLTVTVFDAVAPNPTTEHVLAGTEVAREHDVDLIVALGGGSAMDCAKGVNFLVTNGGRMEDYWGLGKASQPMLPSLGVPTTAGTGSDAQSYTLITQAESGIARWRAVLPSAAFQERVILDPELTLGRRPFWRRPKPPPASTRLSHALESHVTRQAQFDAVEAQLSRRGLASFSKSVRSERFQPDRRAGARGEGPNSRPAC